jgi:hypothetical protein
MSQKKSDKSCGNPSIYPIPIRYTSYRTQSFYLEMRDGVKIAIDLYLPKKLKGEKVPAIIHQTRYRREIAIRKPFSWFISGRKIRKLDRMRNRIVKSGYAWLNIDVRGTGASYGEWKHPWWKEEIEDGVEIIEWILKQNWSNQKIGTTGISYAGTAAEFLAAKAHPALKACIPMYSLFDVYDDIVMPGGVYLKWFVKSWELTNRKLDQNKLPDKAPLVSIFTKGVKKVKQGEDFEEVLKAHENNTNIAEEAISLTFRDDKSPGLSIKMDDFSPHQQVSEMDSSNAVIYSWSGWYDATYAHAAIKRFLSLKQENKKLILGPWDHGGKYNIDQESKTAFDHEAEMLKFFDFHLKNEKNGLHQEAPIHYYTMVEGKWKSAEQWPPHHNKTVFYLSDQKQLKAEVPKHLTSSTNYQVDFCCSSGKWSRYRALTGVEKKAALYSDWAIRKGRYLWFDTLPCESDIEITGHPLVELFLESSAEDGNLFVYLEDVDKKGKATYITEGMLRLIHRYAFAKRDIHEDAVPVRSYLREQAQTMPINQVEKIQLDLLPTSYLLKKGHRLRLSISGADEAYFKASKEKNVKWKIHHSKDFPSQVILPTTELI